MRRSMTIMVLSAGLGWCLAAPVWGQTMEQQGYRPVDQLVEDLDPLGTSLRRPEAGLLTIGERGNVYRRINPEIDLMAQREDRLYFISYGVVAEFDQSQYMIGQKTGAILQFIPANTIFHLGLPDASPDGDTRRAVVAGQITGQLDGLVYGLVEPEVAAQVEAQPFVPHLSEDERYNLLIVDQRSMVLTALNRLAAGE